MPFNLTELTDEVLDQFRIKTDPIADETVSQIIQSGEAEKINEVMSHLFTNTSFHVGMFDSFGPSISATLDHYIKETCKLPDWADQVKIKAGEELFSLYGPEVFMLLNVSSLPLCYTCAKGAQVLFDTGRLLSHNKEIDPLARRLMETAQMVVNVLSKGGLAEGGDGVVTLQKVRLIHASIRYYLKHGQNQEKSWDVSFYGEPINQEDLAGTLMSFAPVILSGLKKLDIHLSEHQESAYMHCWKVVGAMMGINEKLLPDSYQEGFDLATIILKHQSAPSDAGKALTNSCIQFMNYLIPGNMLNSIPNYLMHYFLEDFSNSSGIDLSDCIGLKDRSNHKDEMLLHLSKILLKEISVLEEHKLIQQTSSYFNRKLLEGIILHYNGGKAVQFYIPPSLRRDWRLET